MELQYFGTDLDSAGHHFWILERGQFNSSRWTFGDFPFNPESLPYAGHKSTWIDGVTKWYYAFDLFNICAIAGSCYDKRPGSKSIFFIEGPRLNVDVFREILLSNPASKSIIKKFPFTLQGFYEKTDLQP